MADADPGELHGQLTGEHGSKIDVTMTIKGDASGVSSWEATITASGMQNDDGTGHTMLAEMIAVCMNATKPLPSAHGCSPAISTSPRALSVSGSAA